MIVESRYCLANGHLNGCGFRIVKIFLRITFGIMIAWFEKDFCCFSCWAGFTFLLATGSSFWKMFEGPMRFDRVLSSALMTTSWTLQSNFRLRSIVLLRCWALLISSSLTDINGATTSRPCGWHCCGSQHMVVAMCWCNAEPSVGPIVFSCLSNETSQIAFEDPLGLLLSPACFVAGFVYGLSRGEGHSQQLPNRKNPNELYIYICLIGMQNMLNFLRL